MNEEFKPKAPQYVGDGVAVWTDITKDGKTFLKVKILGGPVVNCFKNEPKEKRAEL